MWLSVQKMWADLQNVWVLSMCESSAHPKSILDFDLYNCSFVESA